MEGQLLGGQFYPLLIHCHLVTSRNPKQLVQGQG